MATSKLPSYGDLGLVSSLALIVQLRKASSAQAQFCCRLGCKIHITTARSCIYRIRFLHVNSPERGRPYYKIAKQFASDKCFRKKVRIRHAGNFDKYGRLLGEVVLPDGKILNKELVKEGLAVHFKKYSSSSEYANLEIQAQKKKIGIWSLSGVNLGKL